MGFTGTVAPRALPVSITGFGMYGSAGALQNFAGNNTFGGPITLAGNAGIGSASGTLTLTGSTIDEATFGLADSGAGNVVIGDSIINGNAAAGAIHNSDFVGFTASSANSNNNGGSNTEILNWTYSSGSDNVDYSQGFAGSTLQQNGSNAPNNLVANASPNCPDGTALQMTNGQWWQTSAFTPTRVTADAFTTSFQFQSSYAVNEGFTFCLQNYSQYACGWNGGNLGYNNIPLPSMAVVFDYGNNNNGGQNVSRIGVVLNDGIPWPLPVDLTSGGINFHSTDIFGATIEYDGVGKVTVTIRDVTTGAPAIVTTFSDALPAGTLAVSGGGVYKSGSGTLALSGANSYAGTTEISQGTLDEANTAAMNGAGITMQPGTILQVGATGLVGSVAVTEPITIAAGGIVEIESLGGNNSITQPLTLAGGSTLAADAGNLSIAQLTETGTAGLIKAGAGTVTLSGSSNVYTGPFTLNAGTLAFNSLGGATAVSEPFNLGSGASAAIGSVNGTLTVSGPIALDGGILTFSGSGDTVVTGTISGANQPGLQGYYYNNLQGGGHPYNLTPADAQWMGNITATNTTYGNLAASQLLESPVEFPNVGNQDYTTYQGNPLNGNLSFTYNNNGPNVGTNNVGVLWVGFITIPNAGTNGIPLADAGQPIPITLSTMSDDGSMLWVDGTGLNNPGTAVANNNNDQGQTWRGGNVSWVPGSTHAIEIGYYQGGGGADMFAYWDLTGSGQQASASLIPASAFSLAAYNQVVKTGSGTATFAPASLANTYVGSTTISGGTLAISSDAALGGPSSGGSLAPVIINAGTLEYTDTQSYNSTRAYTLGDPASTIQVDSPLATMTISSAIGGTAR